MDPRVIVIAGPTASGKSALAVALASRFEGEVVNADSQQVYRGLDIGTGKPTQSERGGVAHHLFDVAEPWEQFDAARFAATAEAIFKAITARGRPVFLVGGTGLWIRALLDGLVDAPGRDEAVRASLEADAERHGLASLHARLAAVDPVSAAHIRETDPIRLIRALEVFALSGTPLSVLHERHRTLPPRHPALRLGLEPPRELSEQRIRSRARAMFEGGLIEETQAALRDSRARPRIERVMGYREALQHIEGELTLAAAIEATAIAQRQYARRQRKWFRGETHWQWLSWERALEEAVTACESWLRMETR